MSKSKNDNYYIFRVEGEENGTDNPLHPKKIEMLRFHADSDDEALDYLRKYTKTANKEYKYYYGETGRFVSMKEDGSKESFNDIYELMDDYEKEHNGIIDRIRNWFSVKWMSVMDFKFRIEDIVHYIRHGHSIEERWGIFEHMLDDLEYNIPILMETVTVPAYYEVLAYKKIHDDASETKFFNSPSRKVFMGNEEQYLVAKKMWNADLERFLEDIRLWRFYDAYGVIDEKNEKYAEIKRKYFKFLPFKAGRYHELDYNRLEHMKLKVKNRIFEFLRKYAETLED